MKPLVSIFALDQTETMNVELVQDILVEFNIAHEIFTAESYSSLDKLFLHTSTLHQKGIEVIVLGGVESLHHFSRFVSLKSISVIYVPTGSISEQELELQQKCMDKFNIFLTTEVNDFHVAGMWAAEILAAKHWSIYNSMNYRRQAG